MSEPSSPQENNHDISASHDENVTNDVKDAASEAMSMVSASKLPLNRRAPFKADTGFKLLPPDNAPAIQIRTIKDEMKVGRGDTVVDYMPEVDLTPYGAYRLGISRQHAKLFVEGEQLKLVDLGSRNGTQINGVELAPHEPHTVTDGDELQFASMKLVIRFE